MENLVLNYFCSMTLFKEMINYGNISKKLVLETLTSSSSFSNNSILRGKILICYFIVGPNACMCVCVGGGILENVFQVFLRLRTRPRTKNSFTTTNIIAKIRSQTAKYNVFCETEASSFMNSVTQHRINLVCAYIYLYPRVELGGGLKRLPCSKYYYVQKRGKRLTFGLNPAKNTDYMKKRFK